MKTLPIREVQHQFGQISHLVRSGEEVIVTQHKEPTLMILSYEVGKEAMRLYRAEQMIRFMQAMTTSPQADALTMEDINCLVHELR